MKARPSLDDVALFLVVAESEQLAAAARLTGVPDPTLSRRMTAFERETGRRLFQRGSRGYALTADGRALRDEAEALKPLAARLRRWVADAGAPPRVRITAGLWTSRFLARNAARIWRPGAPWVPEFLASNANVDIARREADIGIRNRRPEQVWLAGRRAGTIGYAVYGRDADVAGFVALPEGAAGTPSERWLRAQHADRIVTTASDMRLALDLALCGVGRVVLPCFAGDAEAGLMRLSEPLHDIAHEQWIVSHAEARHDPPVRAALDALYELLGSTIGREA